jgi:hypothetical protein
MVRFFESEACFRRYEHYITEACLTFPKEVFFRTKEFSIFTDSARCRDAITSFKISKWPSSVDPIAYAPVLNQITVVTFMGYVVLVDRKRLKLLRKMWRSEIANGGSSIADCEADSIIHAQQVFTHELSRAVAFSTPSLSEHDAKITPYVPEPKLTLEEFLEWNVEDAINAINSGEVHYRYTCPFTPEMELRVRELIGDKLNVAYVVDNGNNNINIF